MQYRSPFSMLSLTGISPDSWDDASLLRVQKQLLVELEHCGGGTLRMDRESWTKDDILKLIDALRPVRERMFHQWIYQNPSLLLLLERGRIASEAPQYDPEVEGDPAFESFRVFISSYLVESVGRGMHQAFLQRDFATMLRFLEATRLLTVVGAEEVLAQLTGWLEHLARTITRVASEKGAFDSEWFEYITPDFVAFLNALPESHAALREWLSVGFVNLLGRKPTDFNLFRDAYKCLSNLHCAPYVRRGLMANYRSFRRIDHVRVVIQVLAILVGLCVWGYGFMIFLDDYRQTPKEPSMHTVPRSRGEGPTTQGAYRSYRDHLRTIVQKQMTPSGADSMRYVLLTNPQVNQRHTLWHHAVPGTHLSNYRAVTGRSLTIVNRSRYDAVLFIMSDSVLYNGFLAKDDSLQTSITLRDELAFYVGNDWESPGGMKQGVYPWTDVKALYGIFTRVDTVTVSQLYKSYHLLPSSMVKRSLRVLVTTDREGLQVAPDDVLRVDKER